jgi:hypothetical protein
VGQYAHEWRAALTERPSHASAAAWQKHSRRRALLLSEKPKARRFAKEETALITAMYSIQRKAKHPETPIIRRCNSECMAASADCGIGIVGALIHWPCPALRRGHAACGATPLFFL